MTKESVLSSKIAIKSSAIGWRLFRNNCGAYKRGRHFIRYGVASPGGSDRIGWRSLTITPEMVGQRIAQFVAVEIKVDEPVTESQHRFIDVVNSSGGLGIIARSEDDIA